MIDVIRLRTEHLSNGLTIWRYGIADKHGALRLIEITQVDSHGHVRWMVLGHPELYARERGTPAASREEALQVAIRCLHAEDEQYQVGAPQANPQQQAR